MKLSVCDLVNTPLFRRNWPDETGFYEGLVKKLEQTGKACGQGSQAFQARRQEILIAAPDSARMIAAMRSPVYIRPLLSLWLADLAIGKAQVPCRADLIAHIGRLAFARKRMGRLALFELCAIFFKYYDKLAPLGDVCGLIKAQLALYRAEESLFGLEKLRDAVYLLDPQGHIILAQEAAKAGENLAEAAARFDIPLEQSRFFEAAQIYRYLKRLEALEANADTEVLSEILQPAVYGAPVDADCLLGHQAIKILMDTLARRGAAPGERWRSVILRIAGDPRMPMSSIGYMAWWGRLDALWPGHRYPARMRQWLSAIDMELFLKIMAVYAKQGGNADMARMYPQRARFLEGLFRKRLVRETRLFLSESASKYLNTLCKGAARPYYTPITGPYDLAAFYLDLGGAHLVDGTHNFMLRIFDKLPRNSVLNDYNLQNVADWQLRRSLNEAYDREFGQGRRCDIRHWYGWQGQAVDFLRKLGFDISLGDVGG